MGLRVAAAGAEDTTGAAGIWPGTVAHDQQLINFSNFTIYFTSVTCNVMLCILKNGKINKFGDSRVKLICGSIKPAI